jgi:osmoprotectant transport system permease protein
MGDYLAIFYDRAADITDALGRHLLITVLSIAFACIVAIPLGVFLAKTSYKWIQSVVFTITNIFQTIPSLAMLAIFIPIIGIGLKPAIVALFLYSLLPILRNTYAAFKSIDEGIVESATGMGYSPLQRLIQIEIPIAVPYIMSGIRLTTVYIINWATLAALIGAGGLGQLIIGGMGVNNKPLILASAIVAMVLALVADFVLARVENMFKKKSSPRAVMADDEAV